MRNSVLLVLAAALAFCAQPAVAARDSSDDTAARLKLNSSAALVVDQQSGEILYGKNAQAVAPIASLTKLMTAMVVLDAGLDPEERIAISQDDLDWLRGSHSRLRVGALLSRDELLRLALMASENRAASALKMGDECHNRNRAASALGRSYPGGIETFVRAMNLKAQLLGMNGTRFSDSTGLSSANVSTAEDLATLVRAAHRYPKIRDYSTSKGFEVSFGGRVHAFRNTNRLVGRGAWVIGLSKTGFINEAGRCLVMQATLAGRAVVIVLLDSWGKHSRIGDANRIRKWLELASGTSSSPRKAASTRARGQPFYSKSRSSPKT